MNRLSRLFLMGAAAAAGLMAQVHITSPSTLPGGWSNIYYTYTLTAVSSPPDPITFSAVNPAALPPGITVSANGTVAGTTAAAGSFSFQVMANSGVFSTTQTILLVIQTPTIEIDTSSTIANAFVGQPYTFTMVANSNPAGVVWIPEMLPAGLSLAANGIISGTPTTTGTFSIPMTAQIAGTSISVSQSFTLNIYGGQVAISTTSLPLATLGKTYTYQIGASPTGLSWTVSGPLPPGITFNFATGTFSGTPTTAGAYPLQLQATYPNYIMATATLTLYVITGPLTIPNPVLTTAVQGSPYSATVAASGGLAPYTWAFGSGNTDGLSIGALTGTVTGTPLNAGTQTVLITVADAAGESYTVNLTIPVAGPLAITTASLPNANIGEAYAQTLASTGGIQPYTWSLTGPLTGLPPGFSISSGGVLSGTPTTAGTYNFTVQVTDSGGRTATKALQLSVSVAPLSITTSSLPGGVLTVPYSQMAAASGGVPPYNWTLAAGSLPLPLSLSSNGTISGTPTGPLGLSTFTLRVNDSSPGTPLTAQKAFTINIALALSITSQGPLPAGTVGVPYSQTPLLAGGGTTPYTWSVTSGSLPPGLQLNTTTGAITGTPTATGATVFTVTVTDAGGQTANQTLSLAINAATPSITTTSLPAATAGTSYSQTLAASGGTPPYTWSASGLPAGLQLNSTTGAITGVPAAGGPASVTFTLTDAKGQTATATLALTVNVPAIPTVTIGSIKATPATQQSVSVLLSSAYALDLTVQLSVSFQSAVGGSPTEVGFVSSTSALSSTATFTIPAGTTGPPPNAPVLITGTVAGTITITASLTAAGTNVTPSSPPTQTVTIAPSAPVITSVKFTNTGGGLSVVVIGYSTTREMQSGAFTFAPGMGSSLSQSTITVQLGSPFATWYSSSGSNQWGGQFMLTIPFSVTGNAADVISVSVTLTNTKGTSAAAAP